MLNYCGKNDPHIFVDSGKTPIYSKQQNRNVEVRAPYSAPVPLHLKELREKSALSSVAIEIHIWKYDIKPTMPRGCQDCSEMSPGETNT